MKKNSIIKKFATLTMSAAVAMSMCAAPTFADSEGAMMSFNGYGIDTVTGATCSSVSMFNVLDYVNESGWTFDSVSKDITGTITKVDASGNKTLQATYNTEGKVVDEDSSSGSSSGGSSSGGSGKPSGGSSGSSSSETTETVTLPEGTELTGSYTMTDEAGKINLSVDGMPDGYSYEITGWNQARVAGSAITSREGTILSDVFNLDTANKTLAFTKDANGKVDALFDGVKEITASIKVSITDGSDKAAYSTNISYTLDLTQILADCEINQAADPDPTEVIKSDDGKSITVTNIAVTPMRDDVEFGEYIMDVTLTKDDNDQLTNIDFSSNWVNVNILRLNPSTGKTGENMNQYGPKYLQGLMQQLVNQKRDQDITAKLSKASFTYSKTKAQASAVSVTGAQGDVSYTSSSKYVKVSSNGAVAISKGAPAGTYTITVNAAETDTRAAASKTLTIKIGKASQSISHVTWYKKYKKSTLKKHSKTFKIGAKATAGSVSYKVIKKSKKLSISKAGKVTVKKGTKKGTYTAKVYITAAKTTNYNAKTISKTIKVVVK